MNGDLHNGATEATEDERRQRAAGRRQTVSRPPGELVRSGRLPLFVLRCSVVIVASVLSATSAGVSVTAQMPDVRQMAGLPLPVGDVEPGTVVVRVVRGSLTNVLPGEVVELQGASPAATATTDSTGRAEFKAVRPGIRVRAVALVDGEKLESQEFTVPASGGIRVLLAATDAEDRQLAQSAPQPGSVLLGDQSRFVFEIGDDGLNVFSMLEVLNRERTPVQTAEPLVLELPAAAEHAALLDGSSAQATLAGKAVTIAGPFAPGTTPVQIAYTLPYSGSELTVQTKLPAPLAQLTILVQKVGDMHLASPQMTGHRDMASEGQTYIVGQGPALNAGDVLTIELTGLPNTARWPLTLALALAVIILAAGAWGSVRVGRGIPAADAGRRRLEARRETLFAELTALEEQHRSGRTDPDRYAARRRELLAALESVYAALDEEAAA